MNAKHENEAAKTPESEETIRIEITVPNPCFRSNPLHWTAMDRTYELTRLKWEETREVFYSLDEKKLLSNFWDRTYSDFEDVLGELSFVSFNGDYDV